MFQSAVSIVVVIFLMIATGFVCQRKGWLGANAQTVMSRLTLRIGMPCVVFSNMLENYTRQQLLDNALFLLVPILVLGGTYLVSGAISVWARIPESRRGVFRALFTFGNTVFVGMPVCRAIFGEGAVPMVLLYYLINNILWWLVGAPNVARDGRIAKGETADEAKTGSLARRAWATVKRLASPPLVATLGSLALVLAGFQPPQILLTTAGYLGAIVTPLSMLFIGYTLSNMLAHSVRWQKGYGVALFSRAVVTPAICLPLCLLLGISGDTLGVFFLQSGMPMQTQSCLWAQEQGADAEYAAGGIVLSTLLGLVAIPAYAWVLTLL